MREHLAPMARQGVPLELDGLPRDAPATLAAHRLALWRLAEQVTQAVR